MPRTFPTATERGILHPDEFHDAARLARHDPCQALAGFVENYWSVSWDLTALTGIAAVDLVDRTVPAERLLPDAAALADVPFDADVAAPRFDAYLQRFTPVADERDELVLRLVHRMLVDADVTRVEQVAAIAGTSTRSLQRLFRHFVGVGPKWLLVRYRLHDAVDRLDAGFDGSLSAVAADLGWTDQAHFSREFTALVGEPPSEYREAARQSG